jgi:poly-gamma-glutamate system protein
MKDVLLSFQRFKPDKKNPVVVWLFLVSLFFWISGRIVPFFFETRLEVQMRRASQIMELGQSAVKNGRKVINAPMQPDFDINRTGLIGEEWTPITTTMGHLEAKRTTTNPNWAAALVWFLHRAGVKKGDTVAVGASGSFPALILAAYAAAGAMDLDLVTEISLGASQWGSNEPDFHWLNIQDCLMEAGLIIRKPAAVSLGGERDIGGDIQPEGRRLLLKDIRRRDLNFVYEPDLKKNVKLKMELFHKHAGDNPIRAFINIGGSYSNLGISPQILEVGAGLADITRWPPKDQRGMLFEMAARGVPVIHMLHIRGLAQSSGLPWDPVPLPPPGEGAVYQMAQEESGVFAVLGIVYLLCVAGMIVIYHPRHKTRPYSYRKRDESV